MQKRYANDTQRIQIGFGRAIPHDAQHAASYNNLVGPAERATDGRVIMYLHTLELQPPSRQLIRQQQRTQNMLGSLVGASERVATLPVTSSSSSSSSSTLPRLPMAVLLAKTMPPVLARAGDMSAEGQDRSSSSSGQACPPATMQVPLWSNAAQDGEPPKGDAIMACLVVAGEIPLTDAEFNLLREFQQGTCGLLEGVKSSAEPFRFVLDRYDRGVLSFGYKGIPVVGPLVVPVSATGPAVIAWETVQRLLQLEGRNQKLNPSQLQNRKYIQPASLQAVVLKKKDRFLFPPTAVGVAKKAGSFSSFLGSGSKQKVSKAAAAATAAAAPAASAPVSPQGNKASGSPASKKRRCLMDGNEPMTRLPLLPVPRAAAPSRREQEEEQLLLSVLQPLQLICAAMHRLHTLLLTLELQGKLADLAATGTGPCSFPVPVLEHLLLAATPPYAREPFDHAGLKFQGSKLLSLLCIAGLLEDDSTATAGEVTQSKSDIYSNAKLAEVCSSHGLDEGFCWTGQGFDPVSILSNASSSTGDGNWDDGSKVDYRAALVTSLVGLAYVTGRQIAATAPPGSNSSSTEDPLVSAAGMQAAAALAVKLGIVPEGTVKAVCCPSLAALLGPGDWAGPDSTAGSSGPGSAERARQKATSGGSSSTSSMPVAWGCVPCSPKSPSDVMQDAVGFRFSWPQLPEKLLREFYGRAFQRAELLGDAALNFMIALWLLRRLMREAQQQQQQPQAQRAGAASGNRSISCSSYRVDSTEMDSRYQALTCNMTLSRAAVAAGLHKLVKGWTELSIAQLPGTAGAAGRAKHWKEHADLVEGLLAILLVDSSRPAGHGSSSSSADVERAQVGWNTAYEALQSLLGWWLV